MSSPIVFMADLAPEQEQLWLRTLGTALPEETILPLAQLSKQQRFQCEVAIVADGAQLNSCPNLKWVHSVWAGVEKLLVQSNLPIVRLVDPELAQTMAESVLAWVLYLHRQMPDYAQQQRSHQWSPLPYRSAQQTRVGILGLGALGSASAKRLLANGYQVAGWSNNSKNISGVTSFSTEVGLTKLLKNSDILVCLLPLTAATRGLLNGELLACLPPGAAIINFARAAIINTDALLAALSQRRLSHAVLDVFDQEPLPEGSRLWRNRDITILPHIAAPTNIHTAAQIVAKNIDHYRNNGEVPGRVDGQRGY